MKTVCLTHICHKHGGRITRITGITHTLGPSRAPRSQDSWYFVGDVSWNDGSRSTGIEIGPWAICYGDEGRNEMLSLDAALDDYLRENGEFTDGGWRANRATPTTKRRANKVAV